VVFKFKENYEKANDNENKQNPTNSETKQKLDEPLTSPLRKENEKEKNKEKEEHVQQILQQQQAKQPILEQTASDVNKQNEEYHSPLRGIGKKIAIGGAALGVLGGVLFAGSMFYLPMAAFGLSGIALAIIGSPLLFIGVVTWVAGLINEATHDYHASQALKQAKRENTDEEQKEKEEQPVLKQPAPDEDKQNKDYQKEDKENKEEQKNIEENLQPSLAQNNQGNEAPKEKNKKNTDQDKGQGELKQEKVPLLKETPKEREEEAQEQEEREQKQKQKQQEQEYWYGMGL